MSGETYAILGGGGSFGVHTSLYLLDNAEPAQVVGIGRNPLRPEPFSLGIEGRARYAYHARHLTYEMDLLLELLDEIRPGVIVNYAAQGEGAASWRHSWRFFETNAMALTKLAEALATRDWLKHFIHIGTSEMYGPVDAPATEDAPIQPTSPYAASKVAFDMYLLSASRFLGFPTTILRPSNCYCPGQLLHRVIPKAILFGLTGRKLPLHGGGRAEKSYLHARDLAHAIHLVAQRGPKGEVFNVGPDRPTSIREVAARCADALDVPFEDLAEIAEERLGQDSRYWLDSTRLREATGWRPEIGWDEGLGEMVAWGRTHLDAIRDLDTGYTLRG